MFALLYIFHFKKVNVQDKLKEISKNKAFHSQGTK